MADRCSWCNTDPVEAAARHEGPHATWCVHYRRPALPPGVYRDGDVLRVDVPGVLFKRATAAVADDGFIERAVDAVRANVTGPGTAGRGRR